MGPGSDDGPLNHRAGFDAGAVENDDAVQPHTGPDLGTASNDRPAEQKCTGGHGGAGLQGSRRCARITTAMAQYRAPNRLSRGRSPPVCHVSRH